MKQLVSCWVYRSSFRKLLSALLVILLCPLYISAEVVDKVVAVINDDIITLSELEEETAGLFRTIARENPGESVMEALEKARETALDGMIEHRLIQQKAEKYNVTVTDEDVDAAYEKMREGMSLNPSEFRLKLEKSGLTEELYRKKLQSQILQSRLLSYDVRSKIIVTDEMVLDYYDENYTSRVDGGSYYLLQIGLSWTASDDPETLAANKAETRKEIERVYNLAKNGQDFRSLAEKFSDLPSASDGGDIGVFTLDEMAVAMRDAIAPLKPGELSKIIDTPAGFQFFKVLSGEENAIVVSASFESVKEEIRQKLFEEKLKEAYSEWVRKLKEDAYIQKM
ncbi:MAG: peptidylprolyl isomerase [Desulforhopalus sp.]